MDEIKTYDLIRVKVFVDGMHTNTYMKESVEEGFHGINRLTSFLMEGRGWMIAEILKGHAKEQYKFSLVVKNRGDKHERTLYAATWYVRNQKPPSGAPRPVATKEV
jgi:hypothetical protein